MYDEERKKSENKTIIFLENESQVQDFERWYDRSINNMKIISLSPFSTYILEKKKISFNIIEDYYKPTELYNLGINNYQRVNQLCGIIDSVIINNIAEFKKKRIFPAFYNYYHIKIVYDAFTLRIFQISKLFNLEKPKNIIFYDSKAYPFGSIPWAPYISFDQRESIYSKILALPDWGIKSEIKPACPIDDLYPMTLQKEKPYPKKHGFVDWVQRRPILDNLGEAFSNKNWKKILLILSTFLYHGKKKNAILLGGSYNWDDNKLMEKGIIPIKIKINHIQKMKLSESMQINDKYHNVIGVLFENERFKEHSKFNNINFLPLVEDRIKYLINTLSFLCLKTYDEMTKLQRRLNTSVFLGSTLPDCISRTMAKAASDNKIPVILWQHGNYGYLDQPMIEYLDIIPSDYLFTFGEGVSAKYKKESKIDHTKLLSIGSSALDQLMREKQIKNINNTLRDKLNESSNYDREKKTILYVTTNFYQNNLYVSFSPPLSDNRLLHIQQTMADFLNNYRRYNVIIKTHPNINYRETPLRIYSRDKGYDNLNFIRNEFRYTDLIKIADLIIIDFPSTTLLQALTTKSTIFTFFENLYIDNTAREKLEKRVYCYNRLKEMLPALKKYLQGKTPGVEVDPKNTEFLEYYGIHKSDGKNHDRAVAAIFNIIGNYKLETQID